MAAAGFVVSCERVPSSADACGVAIRVAADRTPLPRTAAGTLAAAHHILEVMLAGHQVMLGGHLRRMAQPLGDRMGRSLPIEASFKAVETSHLPKKYRSTKTSGLTAEVTEDGPNEFVFELSSK